MLKSLTSPRQTNVRSDEFSRQNRSTKTSSASGEGFCVITSSQCINSAKPYMRPIALLSLTALRCASETSMIAHQKLTVLPDPTGEAVANDRRQVDLRGQLAGQVALRASIMPGPVLVALLAGIAYVRSESAGPKRTVCLRASNSSVVWQFRMSPAKALVAGIGMTPSSTCSCFAQRW